MHKLNECAIVFCSLTTKLPMFAVPVKSLNALKYYSNNNNKRSTKRCCLASTTTTYPSHCSRVHYWLRGTYNGTAALIVT